MKHKSFNPILILVILVFSLTSCTSYTFSYKPNRITEEKLEIPIFTQVNLNIIKVGNNFPDLENEIKQTLVDEMDQVFLRKVEKKDMQHDINILVNVKNLQLKNQPWGLIPPIFILCYFGVPIARNVAITDIEVSLYDNKSNKLIKTYTCKKEIAKWRGIYYGSNNILFNNISNILYITTKSAMDEIKTNIVADRSEINKYWITENKNIQTKQLKNETSNVKSNNSAIEKLKQLKEMLDSGIITQKEYDQRKKTILDSM